ncbi:uncharacterized protein TNCV_4285201 [Trichonephila clavipes]|nr:uncharacterized protein TNCV_4285201 [Trichonephila clavipes]
MNYLPIVKKEFLAWFKDTSVLKNVNIPRHLKVNISSELHVFVDAAGGAYAACVFVRSIIDSKQVTHPFSGIYIIDSLPKVKHGEENANFRKPIRTEEDAIRCRDRWTYANMLGNSQSCFHVKKYAKRAVL